MSREAALANLRRILEPARTHGFFVRIDMENSPYTDATLEIFQALWADGSPISASFCSRRCSDGERSDRESRALAGACG